MRLIAVDRDSELWDRLRPELTRRGSAVKHLRSAAGLQTEIQRGPVAAVVLGELGSQEIAPNVCRSVRRYDRSVAIIILSARRDMATITTHLDAGADDYIVSPVATDELVAHLTALVRRSTSPS